jgi:hypothetical protein
MDHGERFAQARRAVIDDRVGLATAGRGEMPRSRSTAIQSERTRRREPRLLGQGPRTNPRRVRSGGPWAGLLKFRTATPLVRRAGSRCHVM